MVKWTGHSLVQLRHIHDYIAQDSPLYAKRVSDALVRKVSELGEENVRESLRCIPIASSMRSRPLTSTFWRSFTRDGICRQGRFRESRSAARKPKPDFNFIAVFSSLHYLEKCQDSRREPILFCSLHPFRRDPVWRCSAESLFFRF